MNNLQVGASIFSHAQNTIVEEKEAAIRTLQSAAKNYFSKKKLSELWVKNQLNTPNLTATEFLIAIAEKRITIPNELSLYQVVKSLITEVNGKNGNGWTPLYGAARYGNLKVAEYLIQLGANLNTQADGWTPLHIAIRYNNLEIAQLLIDRKANIHAKNDWGQTPFHIALREGNLKVVKILKEKGADMNAVDNFKNTAFSIASIIENLEVRLEINKYLIESGADLNVKDMFGRTPLDLAFERQDLELAKLLIIVDHLDTNNSINLNNSTELLRYYDENKDKINSLMIKRKNSQLNTNYH